MGALTNSNRKTVHVGLWAWTAWRRVSRAAAFRLARVLHARHLRVPVAEGAVRIALPRPDMQLVMRRQAQAVGGAHVVEELAAQLKAQSKTEASSGLVPHQHK